MGSVGSEHTCTALCHGDSWNSLKETWIAGQVLTSIYNFTEMDPNGLF